MVNIYVNSVTLTTIVFDQTTKITDAARTSMFTYNANHQFASYSYGPFGQMLTSSGSWKDLNPWQFSSEYFDPELSLVYYNYRHYSPTLGRWINRDPIEEERRGEFVWDCS